MAQSIGDEIGPYRILAAIGAGGMGDVYRATDRRLNRDVAIKIARDRFSSRFEAEARAVAALNHPNICTLYDVGPNYIVMELIEGTSPKGPLPLEEALRIARQIADALGAAHDKGIVHRDLKPGNLKITHDGAVKVLDFGLAKTVRGEREGRNSEDSPTITVSATEAGMIVGTAAYMSPEQAQGKPVDKRADIWAFGVVLYELLVGDRPFQGGGLTEVLASVMKDSPDLTKAPVRVRRLLASCLEKDPRARLRDIGDAWRLLEEPVPARTRSMVWPWTAAACAALLAVVGWLRSDVSEQLSVTLSVLPPPGIMLVENGKNAGTPEIAPDGSAVLYAAKGQLYVRRLDSLDSRVVAGSETSNNPAFWSADSTTVVYPSNEHELRKVRVPDGAPQGIASLAGISRGGSWSEAGTILLATSAAPPFSLSSVPATGGEFKLVEFPKPLNEGEIIEPEFLPGGADFVFFFNSAPDSVDGIVYLATLQDGKCVKPVELLRNGTPASFTPAGGGRLLFARNDNLYSQRVNRSSRTLVGEPELVAKGVFSARRAEFSVARNGTIAWRPGTAAYSQITEFSREGRVIATSGSRSRAVDLTLSPDEKQFLVSGGGAFWLVDVGQTGQFRLPKDVDWFGWTGGGSRLIGLRKGILTELSASGSGEMREIRKLEKSNFVALPDVSTDGKVFVGETFDEVLSYRIEGTPQEIKPRLIMAGTSEYFDPRFSPDDRWLLYESKDSGAGLFVMPSDGVGPRRQIAPTGGRAVWRGDGKEILYVSGSVLMSVPVEGRDTVTFGAPRKLFSGLRLPGGNVASSYHEES